MRYRFDGEHWVELTTDLYTPTVHIVGDSHYDGPPAQDGTDISSRAKHKAYMKKHGLTTVDDFKDLWKKTEAARDNFYNGVDPSRRQEVLQVLYNDVNKRRK